MALTKADIINTVQADEGFTKQQSTDIIETLIEIIKSTLQSGEDVLISGFGKFNAKHKKERIGRNPSTGNPMMISSRRVVTFKCSPKLSDKINKKDKL